MVILTAVRSGDFAAALGLVTISNPANHADALKRLGDLLQQSLYFPEAVLCYDAALAEPSRPAEALFNRGVALRAMGDFEQASASFRDAIDVGFHLQDCWKMLGKIFFLQGRFDESIAAYDSALDLGESALLRYGRRKSELARDNKLDDPAEIFGAIYAHRAWGGSPTKKFYSGRGSHAPDTVRTYVEAVNAFLGSFDRKLDAVDIGCGDFNIGSQIYRQCASYSAFDVVPALVEHNAQTFRDDGLNFGVLDVTRDPPPSCDVVFIREVFQHLSNAQIQRALDNIKGRYRYLVFTEVEPKGAFIPNKDKPSGENIRLNLNGSGVVLTAPPFNLTFGSERVLCTVDVDNALIRTTVYTSA